MGPISIHETEWPFMIRLSANVLSGIEWDGKNEEGRKRTFADRQRIGSRKKSSRNIPLLGNVYSIEWRLLRERDGQIER